MELENLSLEELWEFFPIVFIDNNGEFKNIYSEEEGILKKLLGDYIIRINHIGSTSIEKIKTKPIVDILIEINFNDRESVKKALVANNYILMNENDNQISFNKGYTKKGYLDKVFHIHIKKFKDCDELYFRDYLNFYDMKALEYQKLKLDLYEKFKPNRDLYTLGKTEFVNDVVKLAKEEFKNRY